MKSYNHSTGGFKPPEVDLHIHKLYLLSRKECNHILPPQMAINSNHSTFPPLYGYILNVVAMINLISNDWHHILLKGLCLSPVYNAGSGTVHNSTIKGRSGQSSVHGLMLHQTCIKRNTSNATHPMYVNMCVQYAESFWWWDGMGMRQQCVLYGICWNGNGMSDLGMSHLVSRWCFEKMSGSLVLACHEGVTKLQLPSHWTDLTDVLLQPWRWDNNQPPSHRPGLLAWPQTATACAESVLP